MTAIDLVDETFLRVDVAVVAAAVHESERWRRWWPDLRLTVFQDRKQQGIRWNVSGALEGSMEVWLEKFRSGVILHFYLRADPTGALTSERVVTGIRHSRQRAAKVVFWALKDELENAAG